MKKKAFNLLLAAALTAAISVPTLADDNTGAEASPSITISRDATYDGTTQRTYGAYKIFTATYIANSGSNSAENKDSFSYTTEGAGVAYQMDVNSPWKNAMLAEGQTWLDVRLAGDGSFYVVTPKESFNNASAAAAFAAYLKANMPSGLAADATITAGGGAVSVSDKGYYLLVANDGAPTLALVTTDVTIVEKNTYISVHKTAEEAAYQIGDIVVYTARVDIPANTALTVSDGEGGYLAGHGPIILHDTMDSSLSFINEAYDAESAAHGYSATVNGEAYGVYSVSAEGLGDSCTFEITLPVTESLLGQSVIFTYSAEVNSTAAGETGLINTLEGEFNGYRTNPDSPLVYTFDFSFTKVFDEKDKEDLSANFELRTAADDEASALSFIQKDGNYVVADSDDEGASTVITMNNGKEVNFVGLKEATYYLVETSTSAGYNMLSAPVEVEITDESSNAGGSWVIARSIKVDGEELDDNVYTFTVENHSGAVLPSTGGTGTQMLYMAGGITVAAALVMLITKKRLQKAAEC